MPLYPVTKLDWQQVIKYAFDEASQRLRTDAVLSSGSVDVIIDQTTDSIRIGDGTNLVTATVIGPDVGLDVNVLNDLTVDITHTNDSVRLGDGTNYLTSTTIGSDVGLDVNIINQGIDLPIISNLSMPTANTEYNFSFPTTTKKFRIQSRSNSKLQLSYISGDSNINFITIPYGNSYEIDNLKLSSILDIYIQSNKNSDTLEIEYWN